MEKQFVYISEVDVKTMINNAVIKAVSRRPYSLAEAAIYLGISEQTLRKSKTDVGFIKIGNAITFRGEDLDAYLDAHYVTKQTA